MHSPVPFPNITISHYLNAKSDQQTNQTALWSVRIWLCPHNPICRHAKQRLVLVKFTEQLLRLKHVSKVGITHSILFTQRIRKKHSSSVCIEISKFYSFKEILRLPLTEPHASCLQTSRQQTERQCSLLQYAASIQTCPILQIQPALMSFISWFCVPGSLSCQLHWLTVF